MENNSNSVDYYGFEGAGGPGAPPPPKPGANIDRARYLTSLSCVAMGATGLAIAATVYRGSEYLKFVTAGLYTGATVAVFDWIVETHSFVKGYFFTYGGHTRIGRLNTYHIPFEMSLGFVPLGCGLLGLTCGAFWLREWGADFWPFSNPALISAFYIPGMLIVTSLIGSYIDYASKKQGIFMNGPGWTFKKHVLSTWIPLSTAGALVGGTLMLLRKNSSVFIKSCITVLLFYIIALTAHWQLYIKKHFDQEARVLPAHLGEQEA
jgi:hypothetical protein